jgi:SAM-dependent methyltransferase
VFAKRHFKGQRITVLDVGCGNHSPALTKKWFKECIYHGADIQEYNLDAQDKAAIDRFFPLTTEIDSYNSIPEDAYDFIIMNHVLEHTHNPEEIVSQLCGKLKKGGVFWLAFPSLHSLELPAGSSHTLQFCDDPTHVRLIEVRDVANALLAANVNVVRGGRSRNLPRFLLGVVLLPLALLTRATGRMRSLGLWYVLGFEDRVIGVKR